MFPLLCFFLLVRVLFHTIWQKINKSYCFENKIYIVCKSCFLSDALKLHVTSAQNDLALVKVKDALHDAFYASVCMFSTINRR